MWEKIKKYLRERDVIPPKPRTSFDNTPCYRCQEFDPFLNVVGVGDSPETYDYEYQQLPCDLRRNYCHSFDNLCKFFKEAGEDFWSSEKWRIENKPNYHYMNYNMWRKYDTSKQTITETEK